MAIKPISMEPSLEMRKRQEVSGYFHSILYLRSYIYILNEIEFMLLHIALRITTFLKLKRWKKYVAKKSNKCHQKINYQNAPMWIALMVVAHIALRCRSVWMWPRPATRRVWKADRKKTFGVFFKAYFLLFEEAKSLLHFPVEILEKLEKNSVISFVSKSKAKSTAKVPHKVVN